MGFFKVTCDYFFYHIIAFTLAINYEPCFRKKLNIVTGSPGIFSYRIAICDSKTWNCDSFLKSWCKTATEVFARYPKSSSEVLNVKFSCATRKYIFRYFSSLLSYKGKRVQNM